LIVLHREKDPPKIFNLKIVAMELTHYTRRRGFYPKEEEQLVLADMQVPGASPTTPLVGSDKEESEE
jgi:hypothetical protein